MGRDQLRKIATNAGIFCLLVVTTIVLVRCAGNTSSVAGMGSANVTISDPPSCTAQFSHVYVTITGVMAHTSATAAPSAAGWQNLTTQLSLSNPTQLDLLGLNGTGIQCLLKQLGSNQSLPVGSYQQIRLILADNGSSTSSNTCTTTGGLPNGTMNCVEDSGGTWYPLELSSQDQTGLKIPPGQIVGGPINVASGKTVDININFNTCSSLAYDPANTAYRLKPTLTASQVSPNTSGISGTVIAGTVVTGPPLSVTAGSAIGDATVNLELPGGPTDTANGGLNTDTIFDTAITDANGNFDFCPLNPQTGGIDVVADAPAPTTGTPVSTSGATIIEGVANGTKLNVPIVLQGGLTNTPGTLSVTPTATEATGTSATPAFTVNLDLFPLQLTASSSGYEFIVPALNGTTGTSMVVSCPGGASGNCTVQSPVSGTASILVPANAPLVGSFSNANGTVTWLSSPSAVSGTTASTGQFVVEANGSVGNSPAHTCSTEFSTPPSTVTANQSTAVSIALSNCQ
ncbi:MAG TPA: DUF4382 domain-containing protein [Patescibacteria group bacterium]|nr:DUF4382 domain-containing protein [Patescibacteria group bacterium]